jgi:hypothetical protein
MIARIKISERATWRLARDQPLNPRHLILISPPAAQRRTFPLAEAATRY